MSRPTKYKKEFDELLIKHMESGMSFMSFAALVGVNVDTLYEWERKQKSFSEAKQVAFNKNLLFWERLGVAGTAGKIQNFNSTTWIFNMKNRHGWRDRREVEHSGNQELPVKFQSMPETKLNELIQKAVSILKDE